ncbi:ATP-binding protein [Hugenholtzia roseola]|uniref:ATP-binding protein n=1 Tax=Hugenholtzia roseola TaxID=1002 RepID=UPI0003F91FEF|nr:ATP-binding protein [Hugenholtzia roseola]
MKLTNLSYIDPYWELSNLQLSNLNLIVAKNATGKSKTLLTIDLLVKMITQRKNLNWGSRWSISFVDNRNQEIIFEFATKYQNEGIVTAEKISIDGIEVLFRHHQEGVVQLKNCVTNKYDKIYPPNNKLTLHVNRDVRKYPYLEQISNWAEQSYGFKFGNISPYSKLNEQEYDLLTAVEDIPNLFKSLKKENVLKIVEDFNSLGYQISDISLQDKVEYAILYVKEQNLTKALPHYKLSQGMFRALAILVYVEYLISRKKPALITIDDFCEGLDYERAKKLGSLVFSKCENTDIQLVVTSNDSFLMNEIDIKYWNILKRNGKKITCLNQKNSPHIFRKFRLTGLSNFDLFSSDFLLQTPNKTK